MPVAKRGTLLIISGPAHDPDRKHLHVVCNDPDEHGNVLVVGVCSVTAAPHDATCILQAHEHEWLHHLSYVFYARARVVSEASLDAGVAQRLMEVRDDVNGQTFLRVKNGICRSPFTPRKVKQYAGCADEQPEAA
ncbi:hypothetical protein [Sphingomonas aracearum]|uniref:Uncharacterized protein n=1 Tax=Sphingomonas aracearum TaxID=2283317 RepID=A0A369W0G6_9SPHN|nr:hypothetical protein [Sphingomonas aracearum]RDE05571.1 hypothetical protein DVW87_10075 [Sphingomonas aracearum]